MKKNKLLDLDKILQIFVILNENYKEWTTPLVTLIAVRESDPFKILISTILSARTKDTLTSKVTFKLFKKIKTPQDIVSLGTREIEQLIFPIGFYKRKAIQIKKTAQALIKNYHGKVPDTFDELIKLDGVGRKTANLVLIEAFKKDAICVDTHVHRISNRLNIVQTKTPLETEYELMKRIPKEYWSNINRLFVSFGQTICSPLNPKCQDCKITKFCSFYKNNKKD